MSNRWPGGLIRKTPVTPAGPYQTGAAPGVWTLAEAAYWTKQNLWPTAGKLPYWIGLLGGSGLDYGQSVAVDSSGNVYVCGLSNASGTYDFQIAKYNTSGVIQWQRRLGGGSAEEGRSIAVDSSGNVYVSGYSNASGTYDFLLAKLPSNGSLTGTYSVGGYSFTYAASSLTDATSSLTDASTSFTDAASSLTDETSSLTDAASTLTSTVTTI